MRIAVLVELHVLCIEVIALAVSVCNLVWIILEYALYERIVSECDYKAILRNPLNECAEGFNYMIHILEIIKVIGIDIQDHSNARA